MQKRVSSTEDQTEVADHKITQQQYSKSCAFAQHTDVGWGGLSTWDGRLTRETESIGRKY